MTCRWLEVFGKSSCISCFAIWTVDGCEDAIEHVNHLARRFINRTPQRWGLRLLREFDESKEIEETPEGDLDVIHRKVNYLERLHDAIHRIQDSVASLAGKQSTLYQHADAAGCMLTKHIMIAVDVAARLRAGPVEMFEVMERKLFLYQDEPI
ncbi:hypothetical protein CONPUDRAFT_157745 [Coniophora puteana RWD-64-598 SS2]|uniref:Uncharacterized protein n=1 Tax=Coniophora puteana (strain RWD-64-598) TaxID=741705 RepID=A0A5M3MBE1_CONPW|nr:uncharacterized protein CONPUDRAFT_157745 [Coniophora puteana RWD-64-598 SS2]EIW76558.1 hypothetical protein CONPUDRAFT_157745 [Coniophora puteana RWD-64-598 SS2]